MKKLLFILIAATGLLFTSCGSDLTVDPNQDNIEIAKKDKKKTGEAGTSAQ